jgi:hypothetical protein
MAMSAQLEYPTTIDAPLGVTEELNEATRWMCSRVLADRAAARHVFDLYCIPKVAAIAPSPGIDMPALARHAAWAVDDDRRVCALVALLWGGVAVGAAAAAFLAVEGGRWWPPLAVAGVFAALAVVWLSGRMAARHARARQVMTGAHVEVVGSDLVEAAQLRRLDEASDGNIIVYEESGQLDDPAYVVFPGFGDVAGQAVQLPVDVSRPLDPEEPAERVEPYELLRHLEKTVPRHIDRTEITLDHPASVVAHVRAGEVAKHERLLEEPGGPVVAQAPGDFVRAAANRPTRGVRAYARTMAVGHAGHLVTTLHLSAVVATTGLSLNFVGHVLRPLSPAWGVAGSIPAGGWGRRWRVLRAGWFWQLLVSAPDEWWRLRRMIAASRREARSPKPRRFGRGRGGSGYGSTFGLRHLASRGTTLSFNERVDLQRQANDLMQAAFTETRAFLSDRNVDPAALGAQSGDAIKAVTANVTSNRIGREFDALAIDDDLDRPDDD